MNRPMQKSFLRAAAAIVGGSLVACAIVVFAMTGRPQFTQVDGSPLVRIGIGDLRPGGVRFFAYRGRAGEQIRFLLARDSAGRIKAAFNACERCYIYRKGYLSSGGNLVCRFCGNRYHLESMEAGLASCVPVKLPVQLLGQNAQIKAADLERERVMFKE